jgi:hypothetical protein
MQENLTPCMHAIPAVSVVFVQVQEVLFCGGIQRITSIAAAA